MSKLLFVYKAKSNLLNPVFNYAHKIISPSTYECKLCKLTHDNFSEKESWLTFKKEYKTPIEFFHKNKFVS